MNRFAHDNIDPSLTTQRRLLVMTPRVGFAKSPRRAPCRPNKACALRLEARLRAWHSLSDIERFGTTRPGSMNPRKMA